MAITLALTAASCAESEEGVTGSGSQPVASLSIQMDSSEVDVGATLQLSAVARDPRGQEIRAQPIGWFSDASDVAAVSSEGTVHGMKAGSATITAIAGEVIDTARVTVLGSVATISVYPESLYVSPGDTVQMVATLRDAAGNYLRDRPIAWTTDDPEVATVGPTGLLVSVGEGRVSIGAESQGVRASSLATSSRDGALFGHHVVPESMDPGERRTVSVSFYNSGTTIWTRAEGYKLGSQAPQDNKRWTGKARVLLDPGDRIEPNQRKVFIFDITAPTEPGEYSFQWRMVHEHVGWFGEFSPAVRIKVGLTDPPDDRSAFFSQSVPSQMKTGEARTVSITYQNIGGSTWTRADGYKLGSQNPQNNTLWTGSNRVLLESGDAIAPAQTKTFRFQIRAPDQEGEYDFQWRMYHQGSGWFGPFTPNVRIRVVGGGTTENDAAAFVGQDVPDRLETGESRRVEVTMRNTGTTTWTRAGGYKLGTQNPQDNRIWTGVTRVWLRDGVEVPPGTNHTFRFDITGPDQEGPTPFQWRMVRENVHWFGEYTRNVLIEVVGGENEDEDEDEDDGGGGGGGDIWETDSFDGLASGPLAGQNGWEQLRATSPRVIPLAGHGKVLQLEPGIGVTEVMRKDVPDQASGRHRLELAVRVDDATEPSLAKLEVNAPEGGGWDKKFQIYFGSSIRINYSPTGNAVVIVPATQSGRWYRITVDMDLAGESLDADVDGSRVASGVPMHPGPITALGLSAWDRGPGRVYLDDILGTKD